MKKQYGSALPSHCLPSPLQPHQPEDRPQSHGKTVLKDYSVGGTLPSPAYFPLQETARIHPDVLCQDTLNDNVTHIPVYIEVVGQQERLQVPCHPFRCTGAHTLERNIS